MYDRSEKILPLDDHTLVSISGSFAKAVEIARYLRHSFKYYSRSQLQPMSLEGKLAEMTKALVQNLPMALQGIGTFVPILSAYDTVADESHIYIFDPMGARFESADYGAAGSGSAPIRGSFDYIARTKGAFAEMDLQTALRRMSGFIGHRRRLGCSDRRLLQDFALGDGGDQRRHSQPR